VYVRETTDVLSAVSHRYAAMTETVPPRGGIAGQGGGSDGGGSGGGSGGGGGAGGGSATMWTASESDLGPHYFGLTSCVEAQSQLRGDANARMVVWVSPTPPVILSDSCDVDGNVSNLRVRYALTSR